jgi:DNA (cytosine-5)-methyltransferase 1
LGFTWAYRTVDARAFGLPQRRKRVFVVASRTQDPRTILFADNAQPPGDLDSIGAADKAAYGFYWTEGLRGLGWAAEATPTVKGGSALGIPSPPAVWLPRSGFFGTPSINDLERLQGFVSDWTAVPGESEKGRRHRYRLVGNAVAVPVATWLGSRLREPRQPIAVESRMGSGDRWPGAAWGHAGVRYRVEASEWPARQSYQLSSFIQDDLQPLSVRAASGFLSRARRGKLRFADGFLQSLAEFIDGRSDEVPRVA